MADEKTIKLMTYNLKFASPTFEPSWEVRREMQVALFNKHSPDIIGTQEGLKEQIDYLMDHLPEYVVRCSSDSTCLGRLEGLWLIVLAKENYLRNDKGQALNWACPLRYWR